MTAIFSSKFQKLNIARIKRKAFFEFHLLFYVFLLQFKRNIFKFLIKQEEKEELTFAKFKISENILFIFKTICRNNLILKINF